jgi:hypothetical protein
VFIVNGDILQEELQDSCVVFTPIVHNTKDICKCVCMCVHVYTSTWGHHARPYMPPTFKPMLCGYLNFLKKTLGSNFLDFQP